jgi:hypothetical protein
MKTKLLLLFFVFFGIFSNAQIQAPGVGTLVTLNITQSTARLQFNINYNGSATNFSVIYSNNPNLNPPVGQTPNGFQNTFGWQTRFFDLNGLNPLTTYYWRVTASNGLGVTQSQIVSFTTLGAPALPVISNVSSSAINNSSAKINYTLKPNHAPTTSVVKYGLASNALTSQVTGLTGNGSVDATGQVPLTTLVPLTTYYYQIDATNSVGTVSSSVGSFTTVDVPDPQVKIAEYNFDNTYNNINGTNPFSQNTGTTFIADRNGNANSALNINNTGSIATIFDLPYVNSSRSISVWAKTNVLNNQINYVFHYGNESFGNGLAFRPTTILYFANGSANLETPDTNPVNTWVHYVCTYDGTTAKIYKNGILFSSGVKTFNTVNNSNLFKIGLTEGGLTNYFNGAVDDLKIYNYVLSEADITSLYNNNTLSSQDFSQNNLEVKLYPNPANDILNIETTLELKSIEIFNIQGQKVLESNQKQINVSNLSNGMYMVKIQDLESNLVTKKVIIN